MSYNLLIDGDCIIYQAAAHLSAWSATKDGEDYFFNLKKDAAAFGDNVEKLGTYSPCKEIVFHKARKLIENIVADYTRYDIPMFEVIISGATNFRLDIEPTYKANRANVERPKYYKEVKGFLIQRYNATVTDNEEADDYIGIKHYQNFIGGSNTKTVFCSRDKDRKTIPGLSYDPFTRKKTEISLHAADLFFYMQMLMGDRVDNIKGVNGIGPKKAARLLENCKTEIDMAEAVCATYMKHQKLSREEAIDAMEHTGQLCRIRRKELEIWVNPLRLLDLSTDSEADSKKA